MACDLFRLTKIKFRDAAGDWLGAYEPIVDQIARILCN